MHFLDPFHLENPSVRIWAKKPVQQPSEVATLSTAKQDRFPRWIYSKDTSSFSILFPFLGQNAIQNQNQNHPKAEHQYIYIYTQKRTERERDRTSSSRPSELQVSDWIIYVQHRIFAYHDCRTDLGGYTADSLAAMLRSRPVCALPTVPASRPCRPLAPRPPFASSFPERRTHKMRTLGTSPKNKGDTHKYTTQHARNAHRFARSQWRAISRARCSLPKMKR